MERINYVLILITGLMFFSCSKQPYQLVNTTGKGQQERTYLKDTVTSSSTALLIEESINNTLFEVAYKEIKAMLEKRQPLSFKRAVYLTENAFLDDAIDYNRFSGVIRQMGYICRSVADRKQLKDYHYPDSVNIQKNAAIFHFLKDTLFLVRDVPMHMPFEYDFNDFEGKNHWKNMFVTKLIDSHKGNCHSMPYLYKILAEEIGAKAHLSLAPNHVFIKVPSRKPDVGLFNTELTNGSFPLAGWIMTTNYISVDAIRKGTYLEALNDIEGLTLTLVDLAMNYERKFGHIDGRAFELKCLELALKYHEDFINAELHKVDIYDTEFRSYLRKHGNAEEIMDLLSNWETNVEGQSRFHSLKKAISHFDQEAAIRYDRLKNQVKKIRGMEYHKMPTEMYKSWLSMVEGEKTFWELEANPNFNKNPFAEFGDTKTKVATVSGGRFEEFFPYKKHIEIGRVVFNQESDEIQDFIVSDTIYSESGLDPKVVSRWLSPDPLAGKFPSLSPYNFANNNPIIYIDPDGREYWFAADGTLLGKYGNSQEIRIVNDVEVFKQSIESEWGGDANYFMNSTAFNKSSEEAQINVSKSIYLKEVSNDKSIRIKMSYDEDDPEGGRKTAAASTNYQREITIFVNKRNEGETIFNDYFNMVNILFHEEQHRAAQLIDPNTRPNSREHFEIFKLQVNHKSFEELPESGKNFLFDVGKGYLDREKKSIHRAVRKYAEKYTVTQLLTDKKFAKRWELLRRNVDFYEKNSGRDYKLPDLEKIRSNEISKQ